MPPANRDALDAIDAIEKGNLDPVYCFHGAERFLIDRALLAIRTAILGPGGASKPSFNHDVFDAKESGVATVINAAKTMPMMAKRRLVVARSIDAVKADDLEPLVAYAADPNPTTVLVLTADKGDKVDGRLRAFAALRKAGFLHEMTRLRGRDVVTWVTREAERRSIAIAPDAAAALAESAGPDLGRLSQALDQVALYAGADGRVTRDAVEALVPESREREIWELTRALGDGDRPRVLLLLGRLLRDGEAPLRIQGSLLRQVRQIWRAKELLAAGARPGDLASALGIPPFAVDEIAGPARRMSVGALRRSFERLYQADRKLKSSRIDDHVQITRVVSALVEDLASPGAGRR